MHREYLRLYERCVTEQWPESGSWPPEVRDQVLRSIATLINGITASAVSSPGDWPANEQTKQLHLQLDLLRAWARASAY